MENASKAILIAGGVLLTMLVVSLMIFARERFSDYYSSQSALEQIEDTTEFNKQFTNYEREDVTGNELISLINKIVDYNSRESSKETNNSQAEPITIKLLLGDEDTRKESFSADNTLRLFTESEYIQADEDDTHYISNNFYNEKIMAEVDDAIGEVGSKEEIESIAKDMKIFDISRTPAEINKGITESEKKKDSIRKYNSYIKTVDKDLELTEWNKLNGVKKLAVYKYYEFVQFKKGIFKCTGITYDSNTGKVDVLNFQFTGEVQ